MIINSAPQNEAIMSNVGEVGEFRIRNSAKAFSILSSGLYANKICAIIRELSCNAVDSHTAAGKKTTPFDVHLPNSLEPWFSIRDYGTGLDDNQVTSIYTTYFESTKADSNEFIGALGLGSKSPFSYTDNFTVTAIKNGSKRIYTAFINDRGVPSIAKMADNDSSEPNGVEVKFSVNDRYDFDKFRQEARGVYKHFSLRPVVSGARDFTFIELDYNDIDIIPGVHTTGSHKNSYAVMGNIAYPISIPAADTTLGNLRTLLNCGLVMHFDIGELDFQASREGLSYISTTVDAIKRKLEKLNAQLTIRLAEDANKISNLWTRTLFLHSKYSQSIWSNSVIKYVNDTKFPLFDVSRPTSKKSFDLEVSDLASKCNITLRGFSKYGTHSTSQTLNPQVDHARSTVAVPEHRWNISLASEVTFVINDTKIGTTERAKYHYKVNKKSGTVMVLDPADKKLKMNTKKFFDMISNPPEAQIILASTLDQKPRVAGMGKNVTIMCLEKRGNARHSRYRNDHDELVWRDAGKADTFGNAITYYVPLVGYAATTKYHNDIKGLNTHLQGCGVAALSSIKIYGVRKGDLEFIKTQPNWVNIDTHISQVLAKADNKTLMQLTKASLARFNFIEFSNGNIVHQLSVDSPYAKLVNQFVDVKSSKDVAGMKYLNALCKVYADTVSFDPSVLVQKYTKECEEVTVRYPLLRYIGHVSMVEIAKYINLVDASVPKVIASV